MEFITVISQIKKSQKEKGIYSRATIRGIDSSLSHFCPGRSFKFIDLRHCSVVSSKQHARYVPKHFQLASDNEEYL